MKAVSVADAKNTLTELLREVESGRPVRISRRGQGVAVLLSEAEYERLKTAGAAADFAAWLQNWRARLDPDFEGISADEAARWAGEY
ncbi:MAG TPA: type II toxin-antitoxin system Phd/YefM family antitoxin [Fontimonas sp.]